MDESRKQFEAWWAAYEDKCRYPVDDVEYYAAKEAWQASRAAIEIELYDGCYGSCCANVEDRIVNQLKANCIAVKE